MWLYGSLPEWGQSPHICDPLSLIFSTVKKKREREKIESRREKVKMRETEVRLEGKALKKENTIF